MSFGKKGRPAEDRLARQYEIYTAIAPLILQEGARRLSMRRAAQAACLSIGGLYHYFPTKRDLVLHGLRAEAILRRCQDFHARFGQLAYLDPQRYIDEGVVIVVEHVSFCRPAIHAALELGTESFWEVIETLLTSTELDFEVNLQRAVPQASDEEVHLWGRSIRRTICAALLDKSITPDELSNDLHMLVQGYTNRVQHPAQAPTASPIETTFPALTH